MVVNFHSKYRKHEGEWESKVEADIDFINKWFEYHSKTLSVNTDEIAKRIRNTLQNMKFLENPCAKIAYDVEDYAIEDLIDKGDKSVESIKKMIDQIKKTEKGAASEHMINRFGKGPEEDKIELFKEAINKYFNGNDVSRDVENLVVGYVLLKIAHEYLKNLNSDNKDIDPTNTKWVNENTTLDAIKKEVEQAIGGEQIGQAKTETQTTAKETAEQAKGGEQIATKTKTETATEEIATIVAKQEARQAVAEHEIEAMSKRKEKLKEELQNITDAPEAKEKMNANLVHFALEISALLDNDTLTNSEKKQLKALIDDLNKAVEETANKHNWEVEHTKIDIEQHPDVKNAIDKVLKTREEISEDAIKRAIETFNVSLVVAVATIMNTTEEKIKDAITESLEEFIKRYKEFMKISRKEETDTTSIEGNVQVATIKS